MRRRPLRLQLQNGLDESLTTFENIDHMLVGTYKSPFLIEGGPKGTDPNASFNLNYTTGQGVESEDTVEFWLAVPKETAKFHQPFDVSEWLRVEIRGERLTGGRGFGTGAVYTEGGSLVASFAQESVIRPFA